MNAQPQKLDVGPHVEAYRLDISAPTDELYRLAADPHRHHEIDGSETVQSRAVGPHELTEGAKFSVQMRRFGLSYRLPLRVTRAEPPQAGTAGVVEWRQPTGHRWRWEFLPHPDGSTTVTEAYDATWQYPSARIVLRAVGAPRQNAHSIRASLRRMRARFEPGG
ncbi:MAG: dimethyladenosine transferase [Nesterenkonia sp.]